ncbi:MAG TPA: outer membrane lipoprotein carrier protein LolA [Sphingomonas sp.]
MPLSRFLILPALLAPVALVAAAPAPELAQIQQHLRAVQTMTASFTQTDRNGRALSGTITLKRPGRIRFEYQKGVPLLVVGDGKALTMIDYQVKQVSRWPIGNTPLSLLLDPDKDIGAFAHVAPSDDPAVILLAGQDPKHREYGSITVGFRHVAGAPGGLMLEGWTILDAQNNRTTVRLSGQRFNVAVADSSFTWIDPRPAGPRH